MANWSTCVVVLLHLVIVKKYCKIVAAEWKLDTYDMLKEEFCNGESFQPRCDVNDVIVMLSARYGRMKIGRCIKEEPGFRPMMEDPQFLGCSADVVGVINSRCSGRSECDVRVVDQNFDIATPCYANLKMYLEASYMCIKVAPESRQCTVSVSTGPQHIVGGVSKSQSSAVGCGSQSQPWTVEGLNGQRIAVSLMDFSALSSAERESSREKYTSRPDCRQPYGFVMDRDAKKNVSICGLESGAGGGSADNPRRVYTTKSNQLKISLTSTLDSAGIDRRNFVIVLEAYGCSDLAPPSDLAWLRRDNDGITIGCYTSRQLWQLSCVDGVWVGTVGVCTQQLMQQLTAENNQFQNNAVNISDDTFGTLAIVAVSSAGLALCCLVICIGIVCLRRQNRQLEKRQAVERMKSAGGSLDYSNCLTVNRAADTTNSFDGVHLWPRQQQQQHLLNDCNDVENLVA